MVLGNDPVHLGLLEHDLRNEDLVRIGSLSPGEVPAVLPVPFQQARLKAQFDPRVNRRSRRSGFMLGATRVLWDGSVRARHRVVTSEASLEADGMRSNRGRIGTSLLSPVLIQVGSVA